MASSYSLERMLMLYCFPVQLVIGLAGNSLNLVVLGNRRMRSNTNSLLAMVALADVLFLCAMCPHTLQFNHYALFHYPRLRHFVLYANHHVTAVINACAFSSAWLVVAVSVERMTAVRWPLRARTFWTRTNLIRLVLAIWALCLLSSSHSHFTHTIRAIRNETFNKLIGDDKPSSMVNTTYTIQKVVLQSTIRPGWERPWRLLTMLNVFTGVLMPVLLVLLTNLAILDALSRERRRKAQPATAEIGSRLLPLPSPRQLRQHRRATFHVLVIAATFALCQTPSAMVHLWEVCWPQVGQSSLFRSVAVLSNSLVVTGKTANHFLLCLWSAHFRRSVQLVLSDLLGRRRSSMESDKRPTVNNGGGIKNGGESLLIKTDQQHPKENSSYRETQQEQNIARAQIRRRRKLLDSLRPTGWRWIIGRREDKKSVDDPNSCTRLTAQATIQMLSRTMSECASAAAETDTHFGEMFKRSTEVQRRSAC